MTLADSTVPAYSEQAGGKIVMSGQEQGRLESWKEIGAYLQRDVRTAHRWEKEEGLPVHRHSHNRRSSVYAYPSEIDAWRASRKVVPEPAPVRTLWRWPAFAATMLLCLVMVGNGIRPVSAQQAGQTARQIWAGPGVDSEGQPSLDGRYLSFTDWETGDLAVRDLTAGTNHRLTRTGGYDASGGMYAESSVISPDGRKVAYAWFNNQPSPAGPYDLRVLPLGAGDNGQPEILPRRDDTVYVQPVGWTPDSKQLLALRSFQDRTNQLALVSVQDGSVQPLKSLGWRYPRRVSLSPNGRYVAYDIQAGDTVPARDILVLALDGSGEVAVVKSAADDFFPIWSPDSAQIVFLSDRTGSESLWTISIRDGKPTGQAQLLRKEIGRIYPLGMTRSGSLHYFVGGPRRNVYIAELNAAGNVTGTPVLATDRFVDATGRASWSPDGQYLAYYSLNGGPSDRIGATGLVIRSLKTGEERGVPLRLLIRTPEQVPPPRWFPDGRSVLVPALDQRTPTPRIGYYRVDLASGNSELVHYSRTVGSLSRNPDLSRDGKTLYYGESGGMFRFDLESRQVTELTRTGIRSFAISPDNTQLAYVHSDGKGASLEVLPATGGQAREIARVAPWSGLSLNDTLAWTPDGLHLVFGRAEDSTERRIELFQVPLAGGQPQKMGVSMPGRLQFPQVHPDGRRIAFWSRQQGANEVWALEGFLPKAAPR